MMTADTPGDVKSTNIIRSWVYVIRSSRLQSPGFLGEVQQAVWSINPNLPLARVRTMQQIYGESMAQTSFVLVILGIAAAVTLLLGVVGIYGVVAYIVSQRRREIGIRMALGARGGEVQRMFINRGVALAAIGLVVGLAAAAGLMRLLGSAVVRRQSVPSHHLWPGRGRPRHGRVRGHLAAGASGNSHRPHAGAARRVRDGGQVSNHTVRDYWGQVSDLRTSVTCPLIIPFSCDFLDLAPIIPGPGNRAPPDFILT